ncbi:MAG: glycosyltransferase family 2 protein [Clostridiales bacterium]|nr:glycosyltransferase family 2 protein [Clostridiales bacterium]
MGERMMNIVAVVVTYNRKDLLRECIEAILVQSYPVSKLIIIDNASTDGTRKMLESEGYLYDSKVDYVLMNTNTGGAGGFYEGIKRTCDIECDWVWLMDDDTIPDFHCLKNLIVADEVIEGAERQPGLECANTPSFLASAVYGPEGEYMNLPKISKKTSPNGYQYWYKFLENGIVGISSATFVSVLIKHKAIEKCGLPCRDYFIWGDDSEYTLRLSTFFGDGYFVGKSVAIHKRVGAKDLRIEYETLPARIDRFHFYYRNKLINRHYYKDNYRGAFFEMIKAVIIALNCCKIKPYGVRRAKVVLRGTWEGIIQYKKFRNYIDNEIK